jgi:hypothetical protein
MFENGGITGFVALPGCESPIGILPESNKTVICLQQSTDFDRKQTIDFFRF